MNTIPQDLAGYQNIVNGTIQPGDVFVEIGSRAKMYAPKHEWGLEVEGCHFDVYRLMDVPRHEGETAHYGKCEEAPPKDGRAKTDDSKKLPLAKLPWKALRKVSGVQAYGHGKYGDFYNYKKGMEITRQISCAFRHLSEYLDGNDLDSESGHSHLAHAATRLLFALENIEDGTSIDDRFKKQ